VLTASNTAALGRPGPRLAARAMLADAFASTAPARLRATFLARPTIDAVLGGEH
jgi:hypothetical protein